MTTQIIPELEVLTWEDCDIVRKWRNDQLETLRTPYPLTLRQQNDFYEKVVCDRNSPHRYWAIKCFAVSKLLGMGGLTNIQWENGIAEISLIVNPQNRRQCVGEKVVELLLDQAFNHMRLQTVFGECYACNPAYKFWLKIVEKYDGYTTTLSKRKFWNGNHYASVYFSVDADDFRKTHSPV